MAAFLASWALNMEASLPSTTKAKYESFINRFNAQDKGKFTRERATPDSAHIVAESQY